MAVNLYRQGSVGTQLLDSIGQTNRVLLNIITDYNTRLLASDIKKYFETNPNAVEVLIFKGHKFFSVEQTLTLSIQYYKLFRKRKYWTILLNPFSIFHTMRNAVSNSNSTFLDEQEV